MNASYAYWNNRQIEAEKGCFQPDKVMTHLIQSGLWAHLSDILTDHIHPNGHVLDLGCGTGWLSAALSRKPAVKQVTAVDFSQHRLEMIDPTTKIMGGDIQKITWFYEDMHDLSEILVSDSVDQVWMCQSFHHSSEPGRLLAEIKRVLRPNGLAIICGEEPVSWLRKLAIGLHLIRVDLRDGDHFYTTSQYRRMFRRAGFRGWLNTGPKYVWFGLRKV